MPGREQMNPRLSEGITGQSADGPHHIIGRVALSLTLITVMEVLCKTWEIAPLFYRTFAVTMDEFTTAFHIKCTKLRKQGNICSVFFFF